MNAYDAALWTQERPGPATTVANASGNSQQTHDATSYVGENGKSAARAAAIQRRNQIAPVATAAIAIMQNAWRCRLPRRIATMAAARSASQTTAWVKNPARAAG